jgi:hypothetical protein
MKAIFLLPFDSLTMQRLLGNRCDLEIFSFYHFLHRTRVLAWMGGWVGLLWDAGGGGGDAAVTVSNAQKFINLANGRGENLAV